MEIKETICWLCKCLKNHGFSNIEPETFRQGKFNSDAAKEKLLLLLGEVTLFVKRGIINDRLKLELETSLSDSCGIEIIKEEVSKLGYASDNFLNSQNCSSRDILLAFGWIFATYRPLDLIMQSYISQLMKNDNCITNTVEKCFKEEASVSDKDKPDYLLWSIGSLKFSLRSLLSTHQRRLKLLEQIHQKTAGMNMISDVSHLSVQQVKALTDPEFLSQHIKETESINNILSCYIHWKEGETLFWQWMESVVCLMNQDCNSLSNECVKDSEHCIKNKKGKISSQITSAPLKSNKSIPSLKLYENKLESQIKILNKNMSSLKEQCQKIFKDYSLTLTQAAVLFP